jgi:hypothetical protein
MVSENTKTGICSAAGCFSIKNRLVSMDFKEIVYECIVNGPKLYHD